MLYSLKDLLGDDVSGKFYLQQLTKAPTPDYKKNFFEIEKILNTKVINHKKYYYVKFLYYPKKFNGYVLADDIKVSKF